MKHSLQLEAQALAMVRSGRKTIDVRLYDETLQQLRTGDTIEYSCLGGQEDPVAVRVRALHFFDSFAELYASLPLLKCGYTKESLADASPADMERAYSREAQQQYGVVGIEVRVRQQDDPMVSASRFMSLVLRHNPKAAGLTLDAHGWADVGALLKGMRRSHPITMEQLEEIVRTDDKQRYALSPDKTRIRARQGHSIPVDVELEACQPPEVLYHGTGETFRSSILMSGLVPKSRLYVHLSPDLETAKAVGIRRGTPVIFIVRSGQMARDGFPFYLSENGVWLTKHVPPVYLEQLTAIPSEA